MRLAKTRLLAVVLAAATWLPAVADGAVTVRLIYHGEQIPGYVTWDVAISSTSDWTNGRLDLVLMSGTIYNDPWGSDVQPNPALFAFVPTLEWDTFVTLPESFPNIDSVGNLPAIELSTKVFGDTQLYVIWFDSMDNPPVDNKVVARLTVSRAAQGTLSGKMYDADTQGVGMPFECAFVHGGPLFPEPATLVTITIGALSLLLRRRPPHRPG